MGTGRLRKEMFPYSTFLSMEAEGIEGKSKRNVIRELYKHEIRD